MEHFRASSLGKPHSFACHARLFVLAISAAIGAQQTLMSWALFRCRRKSFKILARITALDLMRAQHTHDRAQHLVSNECHDTR